MIMSFKPGVNLIAVIVAACIAIAATQNGGFNRDTFIQCSRVASQSFCAGAGNMGSMLRMQLEAAVNCNRSELALTFATECARDTEIGAYCLEGIFYTGDIIELFGGACALSINTGQTCPDECRTGLQALRDALGCCINAVFNNTNVGNTYAFSRPLFANSLWESCGVQPVTTNCTGILPYTLPNTPNTDPMCTYSEQLTADLKMFCTPEAIENIAMLNNQNDRDCSTYVEYFRQICSVDSNGTFCLATSTADADFAQYLAPITTFCTSPSNCSSTCRDAVKGFVSSRGCCVNSLYNSTHSQAIGITYPFLENSDLFELCGVSTPPQTCRSLGGATKLKISFTVTVLLAFIALFY